MDLKMNSLFLLLLCAREPLVQQFLAIVDLPGVHLHSDDYHKVHHCHSGKAKDKAVGLAVAIQLLSHREHLHTTIDQRGDTEEPCADHGYDQVADVVTRQRQEAEDGGHHAQEIGVLPLVRRGHHFMRHEAQLAHCHLRQKRQYSQNCHMTNEIENTTNL